LSVERLIKGVFSEADKAVAATKFINTLAYWVKSFTQGYDLPVYFSGGVFQNAALVYAIKRELRGRAGLIFHTEFSPNDSSLCLGHAGYAKLFFEGKIKENI
jgi:hydrogenase maturation protein HypF